MSEQRTECRDLAPSPALEPNPLEPPLLLSLPNISTPAGHHLSPHLPFFKVIVRWKKCDVSAKQDSDSSRPDVLGLCRGNGRPKLWVVLGGSRDTVSQPPSHSGTLTSSKLLLWSQTCRFHGGTPSYLVTKQQNRVILIHHCWRETTFSASHRRKFLAMLPSNISRASMVICQHMVLLGFQLISL